MMHRFQQRLQQPLPIIADGAMGTQLYERLGYRYVCFEELNAVGPAVVQVVHRAYIAAGAELIETNTFGCNKFLLSMHGLEREVSSLARKGAQLARETQESMGADVFVAGAVGPVSSRSLSISVGEMRAAFREVIEGLLSGGVDLFVLQTFGSLEEIVVALTVCRECSNLPSIASITCTEDGRTLAGDEPGSVSRALQMAGADVVSINCGFGPQHTYTILDQMRYPNGPLLGAMPNAGLPARVGGRLVYTTTPDYFGDYARQLTALDVRLIGGCCGTTPMHIAAMHRAIKGGSSVPPTITRDAAPHVTIIGRSEQPEEIHQQGRFVSALRENTFPISVEMRPPRGANPAKVLRTAKHLKVAGFDVVDVTDSAMARVRMNPFVTAHLIQSEVGLEIVTHLTTRDRNLMALQADLLAMHALGLRYVLALTGDPPTTNSWAPATGIYDLDSIGLIKLIKRLNQGLDAGGTSIGAPTSFLVGCTLNPTDENLDLQLDRFQRKIEAGADFVITQAIYDPDLFLRVLDRIGPLPVPLLLELMPLQSFRNAEFVHNELAGVALPPNVLERMRGAGADGIAMGMEITREIFLALRQYFQGAYIVPAFDRFEVAIELAGDLRCLAPEKLVHDQAACCAMR